MTFATRQSDPLDVLRANLEGAHAHLERIRGRVALRELDAGVLHMAELRYRDCLAKWENAVRGDPGDAA